MKHSNSSRIAIAFRWANIVAGAASVFLANAALAQPASKPMAFPADPIATMQGKWLSNNTSMAVEVRDHGVFLINRSQRPYQWNAVPEGTKVATIGPEKERRNGVVILFDGPCIDRFDSRTTRSSCLVGLQQVPLYSGPYKWTLTLEGHTEYFVREGDLSTYTKARRLEPVRR